MSAIAALFALFFIFTAGFGLSMLLFRRPQAISFVELFALSWLLGGLFISLAFTVVGFFCNGLILQLLVTLVSLLLGWMGLKLLRKSGAMLTWPKPANRLEAALCAILLVEFMAMLFMAARESLGWDGLLVWEIKARYAFLNGGHLPLRYFVDASRLWSHPEYPLFLPSLETWLYLWIGDCDQFWVRVIFPPFYIAAAFLLYTGIQRFSGKKWCGLLAATLLFFLPSSLTGEGNLLAGYADFPLAVFYLAAVVYFLRYLQEKSAAHAILFAIMAGAMPWMKREGVVLWACAMALALPGLLKRRNFLAAILVPLPGLAVLSAWLIASKILKTPGNKDFLPVTFDTLLTHAVRYPSILREMLHEFANTTHWSLLWIAFAIALPFLIMKSRLKLAISLFLGVALPLGLYSSIYLFSAWPSYMDHIQSSLTRLMLQVSLVALLAVSLAVSASQKEDF